MEKGTLDKDPLNLRNLPQHPVPDRLWQSIEARLEPAEVVGSNRRRGLMRLAGAGMAAALVGGITLVSLLGPPADRQTATSGQRPDYGSTTPMLGLADARRLSAELETRLAESRGGVLTPDDVAELVWIESELRLTDYLLADRPGSAELWTRRAGLLDEMNRHYRAREWQARLQQTGY